MRIALVHDYLAQDGGAERVLKAFHEVWPEAPVFVLFHDPIKVPYLADAKIQESILAKVPMVKNNYQWLLPWMPMATEKYDLRGFDMVLSSTSAFAKGVITHPGTIHISYCHTPPRYLWADSNDYLSDLRYNRLIKFFLPNIIHRLRLWDKLSVDRVDHFLANSQTTAQRIGKYYRRHSDVIYPPADTNTFRPAEKLSDYYVAGGRLVPYKRVDLVVKTFNRLGWPLKIFGTGPELHYLQKIAKPNIEFLGKISDTQKAELLSQALAFIHPQLEDFGITPVEAMASGRPVIAYGAGGATETIVPGETGVFFYEQSWESLLDTLLNFNPANWDAAHIREHALRFNTEIFKQNIKKYIEDRYEEFTKGVKQPSLLAL